MTLKDTDLKKGDRVRSIKWAHFTENCEYIGLEGTVDKVQNDLINVKLDTDPISGAAVCPFFPSELVLITKGN